MSLTGPTPWTVLHDNGNSIMASVTRSASIGASVGSQPWTSPSNALTSNNLYASADNTAAVLYIRDFGFSIPVNAVINGFEVFVEGYGTGGTSAQRAISLALTKLGTEYSTLIFFPILGTSDSSATFGDSITKWFTTVTPSEVNSEYFGVRISPYNTSGYTRYIDYIRVTVYYTYNPNLPMSANGSSYSLSGTAASGLKTSKLFAGHPIEYWRKPDGSLILTPDGEPIPIATGSIPVYSLTGSDVEFVKTGQGNFESGSYDLVGTDADTLWHHVLYAGGAGFQYWRKPDGTLVLDPAGDPILLNIREDTYQLTGSDATLDKQVSPPLESGEYTLTGTDCTLDLTKGIYASDGVYVYLGVASPLLKHYLIDAAKFIQYWRTPDGTIITMPDGTPIELNLSSYLLEGRPVSFSQQAGLLAGTGSYDIAGTGPSLLYLRVFSPDFGIYTYTGQDVTFDYADLNTVINVENGEYFHSSQDYIFLFNKAVISSTGGYFVSGKQVDFYKSAPLHADFGEYQTSGTGAELLFHRLVNGLAGDYDLTGSDVTLINTFGLDASNGLFALSGKAATFYLNQLLLASSGIYLLTGTSANLSYIYVSIGRLIIALELKTPEALLTVKMPSIITKILN